jgi:hypothetical protein
MKFIYATLFYIVCFSNPYVYSTQKAVVNVAVTDLIGQQITTLIPHISAQESYENIPLCAGEIKSSMACPRLHQLVYNDIVDVLKIVNDEACISISHGYYVIPSSSQPQTTYWTLKKNLTFLDDITANNIPTARIPQPIDYSDTKNSALNASEIVTLTEPHYDSALDRTFSTGTRFVAVSTPKKRSSKISVFAIDYPKMKCHTVKIPTFKCMINNGTKTKSERIADFVTLLKKWAHTKKGFIPYVWGGTSFITPIRTDFKEVTKTGHKGDYAFYEYEKNHQSPKNGFDCSGIILRAAQICGIAYFCKNTTTIAQCLKPLASDQQLKNGDLILIKGHVMIVSDIAKSLLIEARSYGHGYGKIHEIPIGLVFENIQNYTDLLNTYYDKKAIKRKDKNGKVRDTFSGVQLFSMESV